MSEKHTTQDLVFWLGCRKTNNSAHNFVIDAIIARLRAADALCAVAEHVAPVLRRGGWEETSAALFKAIADYEEGQ